MTIERIRVDTTSKTNYHELRFHSLRPAMRDDELQGIEKGDMIPARLGHQYFYARDYSVQNYDNVLYTVPIQRKKGDLIHVSQHTMGLAEIVLVIDTTGCMIVSSRTPEAIIEIVTRVAHNYPAFRFGIVLFKDCEDANSSYLTRLILNLTTNITLFSYNIRQLYPSFDGGPTEEAHITAIALAIRQMNWETNYKHIIVISDAVPRAWVKERCCLGLTMLDLLWMAYENEIRIHTVGWGPYGDYSGNWWYTVRDEAFQLMSEYTNGDFIVIPDLDNDMYLLEDLITNKIVYGMAESLYY
jgi:hypothetical protein